MHRLATTTHKAVGYKQTVKAVERGLAQLVYLAGDAEEKIRRPVQELCQDRSIAVLEVGTMAELGNASGIQVGTAVAALLKT